MSGYCDCACRDCFEIAIGEDDAPTLCSECEDAGCDVDGCGECQARVDDCIPTGEPDPTPSDFAAEEV